MRTFNCDHCGHLVFFDSTHCVHCRSTLAFVPEWMRIAALQPTVESAVQSWSPSPAVPQPAPMLWQAVHPVPTIPPQRWRLCANHTIHHACNFAVPADDPQPLCISCRQTRWLPDLSDPANLRRWKLIEDAKRRLFYTLARLHLTNLDGMTAPEFEFLADLPGQPPVMTGHRSGTIVLNVAEADDDERARRRMELHEPYRTLVGHLRHESGHFFWDVLVRDHPHTLEAFRALFGDERLDYAQALQAHYHIGPLGPAGWEQGHVSAYATAHPWEDWAETWAHYLHMVDLMETAASYRTEVTIPGENTPYLMRSPFMPEAEDRDFDAMLRAWVPLTLLLNSLNRSLGQNHAYPFALSSGAITKLRFVHDLLTPYQPLPAGR